MKFTETGTYGDTVEILFNDHLVARRKVLDFTGISSGVIKAGTPIGADGMGSGQGNVSIVGNGVAVSQIVQPHPVNIETIVSEIVLPSFERMDEVGVLKVV